MAETMVYANIEDIQYPSSRGFLEPDFEYASCLIKWKDGWKTIKIDPDIKFKKAIEIINSQRCIYEEKNNETV